MDLWQAVAARIQEATGDRVAAARPEPVGGGCINQAFRLSGRERDYFVKTNAAGLLDMFEAEAEGLNEIVASGTVRAPAPVCWGENGETAWLVMEYLPLGGSGRGAGARLGEQLAAMHRVSRERFGWHRDNTIGSTPQVNTDSADWVAFWREHRLRFQYELAARHGHGGALQRLGERLLEALPAFFTDYAPQPSLLHGDLWSGNYSILDSGAPAIFDPAVYYGDREADIAMTELFGGFGRDFYAAYNSAWPLDPGYPVRKTLYNLYHILNHLNLFGGGYLSQAIGMTERLLAELG